MRSSWSRAGLTIGGALAIGNGTQREDSVKTRETVSEPRNDQGHEGPERGLEQMLPHILGGTTCQHPHLRFAASRTVTHGFRFWYLGASLENQYTSVPQASMPLMVLQTLSSQACVCSPKCPIEAQSPTCTCGTWSEGQVAAAVGVPFLPAGCQRIWECGGGLCLKTAAWVPGFRGCP